MTCAHVRLLGPCFKTGRMGNRPMRHRPYGGGRSQVPRRTRLASTASSPGRLNARSWSRAPTPGESCPRSPGRPTLPGTITLPPKGELPFPGASDGQRSGRDVGPAESAPVRKGIRRGDGPRPRSRRPQRPRPRRMNPAGPPMRSHPFASIRFHVLLNSLFKVLFNFPSRYLFAIGLVPVFSLRWSLPPT